MDSAEPSEIPVTKKDSTVILRVSADTQVQKLATAIFRFILEGNRTEIHCVGAGPVNQAVKALVRARQLAVSKGLCLAVIPWMDDLQSVTEGGRSVVSTVILRAVVLHDSGVEV